MTALPALYLSHGSPMIAMEASSTQAFLRKLGPAIDRLWGRPRAIVIMSAHTMQSPAVLGVDTHQTIHDFGGFPPELYALRYDAPGSINVAREVSRLLTTAGLPTPVIDEPGLDHGIWTALMHLWPQADVPVVPLALPAQATPDQLWAMGQALQGLPGDVIVIGSGSLTHNLRRVFQSGRLAAGQKDLPEDADCAAFRAWVEARAGAGDWAALRAYRQQAPHAAAIHPTDEHWRPFYLAAGAGTLPASSPAPGLRLHADVEFGCLAMDAYGFGPGAPLLAQALHT
ncbi:MAG: dioxygenase [Rubrivivax sp.]|nr:MAG: dioxygenase [Rubrivivax sp.]